MSVGRTTIYGLMASGELRTVSINSRRLVLADSVRDYVNRLSADSGAGAGREES